MNNTNLCDEDETIFLLIFDTINRVCEVNSVRNRIQIRSKTVLSCVLHSAQKEDACL